MKIKSLIALFLFLLNCSGPQRTQFEFRQMPEVVVADARVDEDAYASFAPSISDSAFRMAPRPDSGELIAPMRQGEQAPFNGVLFNGPALARVEVEFRGEQQRCLIDRQADIQRVVAQSIRDINLVRNTSQTNETIYRVMLQTRDQEIERMQRYIRANENRNNENVLNYVFIGAGAAILGAGIAGTIVYFVKP